MGRADSRAKRFRGGYLAVALRVALIVLGGVSMSLFGMALLGASDSATGVLVLRGLLFVLAAAPFAVYYVTSGVDIDAAAETVTLRRFGAAETFRFDEIVALIPQGAAAFPRAARLQVANRTVGCPLVHQGRLIASRGLQRFAATLEHEGITTRPIV